MSPPLTLTVTKTAALLGVTPSTVYQKLYTGTLPARWAGSCQVIPRAAVLAYKRQRRKE